MDSKEKYNIKNIRKKDTKKDSAITIIALVITVIVLLILATVSVNALRGENGILKRATDAKEQTHRVQEDQEQQVQNLKDEMTNINGYNKKKNVNNPKIITGMIPIKWKDNNWVVCSEDDVEWYNYDKTKKWANVMLSDGKYKSGSVQEGQIVSEQDLGSMYVWIPRYAYQIMGEKNIKITFLKGNTNQGSDGTIYTTDENTDTTQKGIVHPGFNLGGTKLKGFWVAKFEASGTDKNGNAVGNASSISSAQQYAPDDTTVAESLPKKISWRHISIGESEKRCMDIATTSKEIFKLDDGSSHLIKNSEWGAVAYLCYSEYGNIPMINGTGIVSNSGYWYDLYTGQGPKASNDEGYYNYNKSHNYNTENGVLASTTGNITGVYDMSGGAWERVAGYLDNENANLNSFGNSKDEIIKYFENGKLKSEYANLWDSYEVSNEEKNDEITISNGAIIKGLWDWNKRDKNYQEARLKITKYNFDQMSKHKGIGINEITNSFSFYAPYSAENSSKPWGYFITADEAVAGTQHYGEAWDNDLVLIGHQGSPFIIRGGGCHYNKSAGVLCSNVTNGIDAYHHGFRAVLIL